MNKIKERLKEPSTHAGLAAIVGGVGLITHSDELQAVAGSIGPVAEKISHADYMGALLVAFGSLAVLLREKGK